MAELANKKGGNNNAGIIQSTRNYIDRMLKEVSEMKIMLFTFGLMHLPTT